MKRGRGTNAELKECGLYYSADTKYQFRAADCWAAMIDVASAHFSGMPEKFSSWPKSKEPMCAEGVD